MGPEVSKRVSCPWVILKSNKNRAQQSLLLKALLIKNYDIKYEQNMIIMLNNLASKSQDINLNTIYILYICMLI